MKIFVIILSFNSGQYIKKCLDSVLTSSIAVDVVVVENASKDDSVMLLKEYEGKIHFLPQKHNLGFAAGNNVGIAYAMEHGADYLFLLNMDTYIEKDTIEKLRDAAENSQEKLLLCPLPKTFAGKLDLGFAKNSCSNLAGHEFRNFVTDLYDKNILKKFYRTDFICASALFMPVAAIKECGSFCPLFYPAYYEDNELFNRMTYNGWSLAFVPESIYYHDVEDRKKTSLPDSHLIAMRFFSEILDQRNAFTKTFFHALLSEAGKSLANISLLRFDNFQTHLRVVFTLLKAYFPLKKYRKTINTK